MPRGCGALRPRGLPLPAEDWERRHGAIATIALGHVPVVLLYAVIMGFGIPHAILETLPVAGFALLGRRSGSTRRVREVTTTLSLVTSSAVLIHLSGGYIELHFHFFVVVGLVTLYQQWAPFLLAIAYVGIHHGVAGVIDPSVVYNHPAAMARPWAWAGVHAAFITMASAVGMANWRLNELARLRAREYYRRLYEGERALVRRLEDADRLKSELVATASHELRTPLTAVLGFAAVLRDNPGLPGEQVTDMIGRIHRQARRLEQLVENLLETERPPGMTGGCCDAGVVVAASVEASVEATVGDTGGVQVEVAPGLRLPLPDRAAALVVGNLVGNALKFATPGTPVDLRVHPGGDGGATIEVANVGPPPPERLGDRIFEPFVQGDASSTRLRGGVGLGLHLVRRIVTAHGGRVTASHGDGRTTFTVHLPGTPPASPEASAAAHDGTDRSGGGSPGEGPAGGSVAVTGPSPRPRGRGVH